MRALGHPHLLEARPVVGGSLVPQEPGPVLPLEREVHLEAAEVRSVRVAPRALIPMDTDPGAEMGRPVARQSGGARLGPPGPCPPAPPLEEGLERDRGSLEPWSRLAHQGLPPPRDCPVLDSPRSEAKCLRGLRPRIGRG